MEDLGAVSGGSGSGGLVGFQLLQNTWMVRCQACAALGIAVVNFYDFSEVHEKLIFFPAEVLTRIFHLVSVPLLMSAVIVGICDIRVNFPKKIAVRMAVYFAATTLMSVAAGLSLMLLLKPGVTYPVSEVDAEEEEEPFVTVDSIMDLFRSIIPTNLVLASFKKYKTTRMELAVPSISNSSLETLSLAAITDVAYLTLPQNATEYGLSVDVVDGFDVLGLLVISLVLGLAISSMKEKGLIYRGVIAGVNELIRYSLRLVVGYMPLGLLLVSGTHVVDVGEWKIFIKIGKFTAVVLVGLILHAAVLLPLLYFAMVRRSPVPVIRGVYPALRAAFFSSSSTSALPLTSCCCKERNRIDRKFTGFMLPIANQVNKDGTALFQAAAAVFIAQLSQITVTLSMLITISVTALVATIGAASVPESESMITVFVLTMVGLPLRDVALLVLLELLLARCNTLVNVLGDCVGAALVHHMSQRELEEMVEEDQEDWDRHLVYVQDA
ncbi:excitatory amino acid transporter 3-like [Odontesthes bonariensis]|uniref:excitatory amino acid transporter 3-like n=1 Tax=Odontesthes bonariensis TaxID=219752 RepID=UPI003F589F44